MKKISPLRKSPGEDDAQESAMASSYEFVLALASTLSREEQKKLVEKLASSARREAEPSHSTMELEGLGKEIWQSVDVDEYLRQERDSWNR